MAIQIGGNHCSAISSRRAGILTRYALFFIFSTIAESYAGSLDGNWQCDDGGIYTVTQNDHEVTWTGTGSGFANVFSGHIQGPIIVGSWHDTAGSLTQSSGGLQLRLVSPNHMVALNKIGGFGGSNWTKILAKPPVTSINLAGDWKCNDGGIYRIQQEGDLIVWKGNGPGFVNEFTGHIEGDLVVGQWTDVAGSQAQNNGTIALQILDPRHLIAKSKTGGFDGSDWRR